MHLFSQVSPREAQLHRAFPKADANVRIEATGWRQQSTTNLAILERWRAVLSFPLRLVRDGAVMPGLAMVFGIGAFPPQSCCKRP